MIYCCTVAISHEIALQKWKGQLNEYIKRGKAVLHADFGHVTVCCDRVEL